MAELFLSIEQFIWNLDIKIAIDILIVSFLAYIFLLLIKQTNSFLVLGGFLIILFLYTGADFFELNLTRKILGFIVTFLVIILVVIFRQELRRFFELFAVLGKNIFYRRRKFLRPDFANALIQSIDYLVNKKIGALMIIPGNQPIDSYLSGGYYLNGMISMPLILSIFDPASPGHDGAIIIENNTIKKFAVHLPLAESIKKIGALGTRHRAGLGISEKTDALVIIVSEERGEASIAYQGTLRKIPDSVYLQNIINAFIKEKFPEEKRHWHDFITNNFWLKLFSLLLSLILWFIFILK
jgi:diadenylate cyclase